MVSLSNMNKNYKNKNDIRVFGSLVCRLRIICTRTKIMLRTS